MESNMKIPNYRLAYCCDNCLHFDSEPYEDCGNCTHYRVRVLRNRICDIYTPYINNIDKGDCKCILY
jgi:hypothetical protein